MDKTDVNKFCAEKLKRLRIQRNLTQKQLAEDLNVTQQQIERYENNKRKFKQDFLFQLADYFNVSINDFFPPIKKEDSYVLLEKTLREKGYINKDGIIEKDKFEKLVKLADMINDMTKKE